MGSTAATASKMVSQTQEKVEKGVVSLHNVKKLMLVTVYVCVSATLIRFNKFMLAKERFPYPMFLTACHMVMSLVLCLTTYAVKPAAFPGAANAEGKKWLLMRWMMPIGLLFAISLFASNQAYVYCNVSFLQFMKEANVIICFLLSVAVGLQSIDRIKVAAIVWIIASASLAVGGEMNFVMIGFVFQLFSQLAECSRVVMGEMVLGGGGLKLDPLSYTMFVAPFCLVALIAGNVVTWDPAISGAFMEWRMYILPNSVLAFVLNILIATIIKEISAVGFIMSGICKDIFIVVFSCLAFGEVISLQQVACFVVTLAGVGFWSLMKTNPDHMVVKSVGSLLCVPMAKAQKNAALKQCL